MEKMKQIMYGVTDFARIRAENGYFVDRTALIRELEKTRYALFPRSRRFGKSLHRIVFVFHGGDVALCEEI